MNAPRRSPRRFFTVLLFLLFVAGSLSAQDSDRWLRAASEAAERDRTDSARIYYRRVLAIDSATARLRAYAGLIKLVADRSDYTAADSLTRLADPLLGHPTATPAARYAYRRTRAAARSLDGRHREALDDLLALTREPYVPPAVERLRTHEEIALAYNRLFVPDSAVYFVELAHEDARRAYDTMGLPYAYFQNDLTVVYIRAERFGEAEAAARRGIRLLEAHDRGTSEYAANAIDNLANVLDNQERYEEALTYRQRALHLYERLGLRDKHARSLYNLGVGRYGLGDFGAAAQYVDRSLRIRIELLGADHPSLTNAYHAQSVLQSLADNHAAAIDAFRNLITRTQRNQGSGGEALARFYEGLGLAFKGYGKLDSALFYQEKAIDLLTANGHAEGPAMARSRYNYSGILDLYDRPDEALRQVELALTTFERLDLDTTQEFSQMLAAHADRLARTGRLDEARQAANRARSIIRPQEDYRLGTEPLGTLDLLCQAAYTAYQTAPGPERLARFEQLEADFLEVAEATRRQFHDPYTKGLLNRQVSTALARHVDNYAELHRQLGEPRLLERVYVLAETSRAALMRDRLQTSPVYPSNLPDSIPPRMADYQRRIETLYYAVSNGGPATDSLRDALYHTRRDYDSFLGSIKTNHPAFYQLNVAPSIRARTQVQGLLEKQEKDAVIYIRGERHYYALLGGQHLRLVDLGPAARIDSAVQTYRRATASVLTDDHLSAGHALYRLVWEPVAPLLQRSEVLIFPSDQLALLSFEALSRRADAPDYLIYDYTFHYAYSPTLYHRQQQLPGVVQAATPIVIAPGFSGAAADSSGHLQQQPWAVDLAHMLEARYGARLLTGSGADETGVRSALTGGNLLLFATHGRMDPAAPLRSGIELTSVPATQGDGRFTLAEVFASEVPADLAILGLCESGLGEPAPGDGMLSLAYAFTYAGCASTMNTLWMVDEVANSELLERTLAGLADGRARAAALRKAKLDYLAAAATPALRHPYYWSGLVLQGKDGPVAMPGRGGGWKAVLVLLLIGVGFFGWWFRTRR